MSEHWFPPPRPKDRDRRYPLPDDVTEEPKCTCVSCAECNGTGDVWISFSGEYMGRYRCDDLDELEMCADCGGSGITEMCDYCRDEREEEENG